MPRRAAPRNCILVLGDQLDEGNAALEGFEADRDRVLMIEAPGEGAHVWSHKARIALFLAAMRQRAAAMRAEGRPTDYLALGDHPHHNLAEALRAELERLRPQRLIVCEPGEWRVELALEAACAAAGVELEWRAERHFLISREAFAGWAGNARSLRMEFFYRWMRRRTDILMNGKEPAGGQWNFDRDNRASFGRAGPGELPAPVGFAPDATTREALAAVQRHFPGHPGSLARFDWPVRRDQALRALDDFVAHRLAHFGRYQDAMWSGEPYLHHARLSAALNLKLLDPREVIAAALRALEAGAAPLASVEGFVRQVLGWREFVRGIYWLDMPGLAEANHFGHTRALPRWYWTGETHMRCLREAIGQTLALGYAHHIQRLMVTGNFALIAGVDPRQVCDWYLAAYVDAVEWAELPNTAGMALYANGGRFTSKPYCASGAYIKRMSNYCTGCRYRPGQRSGPEACPVTVLFWHFLDRNAEELAANPRTRLMARSVERLGAAARAGIRREGERCLAGLDAL